MLNFEQQVKLVSKNLSGLPYLFNKLLSFVVLFPRKQPRNLKMSEMLHDIISWSQL